MASAGEKQSPKLKKWMQTNQVWQKDLYRELLNMNYTAPNDIRDITQDNFDELIRLVTVARVDELKDQMSRQRNEELLARFERLWRQASGIQKPSARQSPISEQPVPTHREGPQRQNETVQAAPKLKKFLQSNQVWNVDLYNELLKMNISDPDQIGQLSQTDYDELVRLVRVARVNENVDQGGVRRAEELLTKFERIWRSRSGIRKTNIKPGGAADNNERKETESSEPEASPKLKRWLQKNECFSLDLYRKLLEMNIRDPEQIKDINESQFEEIDRTCRIERVRENADQGARDRIEKLVSKFEKLWRQRSGIRKTAL